MSFSVEFERDRERFSGKWPGIVGVLEDSIAAFAGTSRGPWETQPKSAATGISGTELRRTGFAELQVPSRRLCQLRRREFFIVLGRCRRTRLRPALLACF